jgi:hypothetical protein
MTTVPVKTNDLNDIIYKITRDFIEEKAISGVIQEQTEEITQDAVKDVIFIVERYMYYINEIFSKNDLEKSQTLKLEKE